MSDEEKAKLYEEVPVLPTEGKLGRARGMFHTSATAEELTENNFLQNGALNAMNRNMVKMQIHIAEFIEFRESLKTIKKYAKWIFGLLVTGLVPSLGLGIYNWFCLHWK